MNFVLYVEFETAERTLLQSAAVFVEDEDRVGQVPQVLAALAHEVLPVPTSRAETAARELYKAHVRLGKDYEAGRLSKEDWDQFRAEFDPAYQVLVKATEGRAPRIPGTGQRKGMTPAEFGEYQRSRVVEFIKQYAKDNQTSPSVAEMSAGLELSETNVARHIKKLIEEGRLEKGQGHRAWRVPRKAAKKS